MGIYELYFLINFNLPGKERMGGGQLNVKQEENCIDLWKEKV